MLRRYHLLPLRNVLLNVPEQQDETAGQMKHVIYVHAIPYNYTMSKLHFHGSFEIYQMYPILAQ